MKLNKIFISAVLVFPLFAKAGIPVMVDADPLRQAEWVKEAQRWVDTAKHYQSQLQAYKDQLATSTGLRDIQGLVSQGKGLKNDIANLQKQGISLDSLLTSSSAPSGTLDTLYNKFKGFDVCDEKQAKSYINICKQETVNKAWAIEQTAEVQEKISDALNDISGLTDRMANAKDIKESQDLANAVQAKSIQLNVLSQQWEINMKSAEQRDKLLSEKRRKAFRESQITAPVPQFN